MRSKLKVLVVFTLLLMSFSVTAALITEARHKDERVATPAAPADDAILKCPKCQNEMENGFLPDNQGYNSVVQVGDWALGPPRKQFGGNIVSDVHRPITAFRCKNCGYIELYAK